MHPSASCPSCPTPPWVRLLQVGPHRHVSLLGARPPRTRPSVMSQAPGRGSSVSCWDRRASEPGQVPPPGPGASGHALCVLGQLPSPLRACFLASGWEHGL